MDDGGYLQDVADTPQVIRMLDGSEQPDIVSWTLQPCLRQELRKLLWALGQEEPIQIWGRFDHFINPFSGFIEDRISLHDVGHGTAKHLVPFALLCGGSIPFQRLTKLFTVLWIDQPIRILAPDSRRLENDAVMRCPLMSESPCHCLGIAVIASRGNVHTPNPGIECMV